MPGNRLHDIRHFLATLNCSKLINAFKIYASYCISVISRTPVVWGQPYSLSVEPGSFCNLNCPECETGSQKLTREKGFLTKQLFSRLLDQCSQELCYLNLSFQGEPFLNPDLYDFISEARSRKVYVSTYTNGHFLNDENVKKLIASGLDRITIALDGTDPVTYSEYRRGGDFETVINGIKRLVNTRNSLKIRRPYIILQFLVLMGNQHQVSGIKKLGKSLGADEVLIKTAQVLNRMDPNSMIPDSPEFSRYSKTSDGGYRIKKNAVKPCFRIFSTAVITWDGKVVSCCYDKDAHHQWGTLENASLSTIWRSDASREFRKRVLKNRMGTEICRNCIS